jgi:GTP-binding protein LepA
MSIDKIRNFCIIAHIDHGKSTLADRLLEETKTISTRELQSQTLDDMDLEREKGITIKSHAIQMDYMHEGEKYTFNLIDTPGHVDFSYEVSRAIAACEGALLLVDATQGIQAQTISNLYLALDQDLEIIPCLNKIDLQDANPEEVKDEIVDLIGCSRDEILSTSGKTGEGVPELLEQIITRIHAPKGEEKAPLQAMVFDSVFNSYRGVIAYFRVFSGEIRKGDKIRFMNTGEDYFADEIGILRLEQEKRDIVRTGDVGYLITGVKESKQIKVGETITLTDNQATETIQGFEEVKPMVFAGLFPVITEEYEQLRESLEKLQLNDASLVFEPETSVALGFGFRCGFLGMLHLEIIQERLDREFGMSVLATVPNVPYIIHNRQGEEKIVTNPSDFPDPMHIDFMEEPFIKAQIITQPDYIGPVMNLCIQKRGMLKNQVYLSQSRVELNFELPLAEIVFDFYDKLKTVSKGYASFDYAPIGYQKSNLSKLDIKLNGDDVDALSALIHRDKAYEFGKKICAKLKELIPRQQFDIAIQAAIGSKILARETVKAVRKDVTAKCYGGDISRKRKLLEKQKAGKKRMRQIGNVEIPQKAFMAVLKLDD